jgi:hypothetical protein
LRSVSVVVFGHGENCSNLSYLNKNKRRYSR